ncbi:MAG: Crp/Fnr family transcriptional regulator [Oscillospiraceae bacterium]|nr:Crp/Fnr family transcriptional regulator [Oscillospiraceae bacterium]
MTEKQLFDRYPQLRGCDPVRKVQLLNYFSTAPESLLDYFSVEELPKDRIFVREGDAAQDVFLVVRGSLKAVDYRIWGIEYEFMHFNKVYALGAMEIILERDVYSTTLKTVEHCLMIRIPRKPFEAWLMSDVRTLRYESRLMGENLLEEGRLSRAYLFLPGPERLAKILVQRYEVHHENGILRTKGNRQELANATGFNIKTVTRAVKSLEEEGLLCQDGRDIVVDRAQYDRLKELVDNIVAPEEK